MTEKAEKSNYFSELFAVDCSGKVEKKNGLSYLSWAWAWAELKKRHPAAFYTVYENAEGLFYHTDGRTCWVKTGVTVDGIEHIEYLPVMDVRNRSIPRDQVTSFDVNKAIQRSLTKACARHGLGLYIYAGEDLPEDEAKAAPAPAPRTVAKEVPSFVCTNCGEIIKPVQINGEEWPVRRIAAAAEKNFGRPMCMACMQKLKANDKKGEQNNA